MNEEKTVNIQITERHAQSLLHVLDTANIEGLQKANDIVQLVSIIINAFNENPNAEK